MFSRRVGNISKIGEGGGGGAWQDMSGEKNGGGSCDSKRNYAITSPGTKVQKGI